MLEIRESEDVMTVKEFITEAKKRGLAIGSLTADQKKQLEEFSNFEEACVALGISLAGKTPANKENPVSIYLADGEIKIPHNADRDMGFAMAGDIIKNAVYGLIPKMFELNLTGPTFYRNEQFQSQISRIYEILLQVLHRNLNYTENDLLRFIVNNISLGAIYYIVRRKYGFSQFITDDCPEFYNLWNIQYNHNAKPGIYTNCSLNAEMLNPSDNDNPATSDWNRIDTTAVIEDIEKNKYWLYIPNNINTLFQFWFDNIYILDDDYHNRKFSFASVIDLDWLEFDPEKSMNVNKRINVSELTASALYDLLNSMIGDVKFKNIRTDIANAEQKGMKINFSRTIFSITDYIPQDHLVKSKTYVQALTNAYTKGTDLDTYNKDNFLRLDWIDESYGGDPYTALLPLGQFARGVRNTNVIGFQAVNYVMRVYANAEHIIAFSTDRSGVVENNITLSTPSVLVMTSNYTSTATAIAEFAGITIINDGSSGDSFDPGNAEIKYTSKVYAHNATFEPVIDPYSASMGAQNYNCYNISSESCAYYNTNAGNNYSYEASGSEISNVLNFERTVVMGEFYAGNGFYLSDNQRDSISVKSLVQNNTTKIWMQLPMMVLPIYDPVVDTYDDETIQPTYVHILCYAWEWDLYTRQISNQHFNVYKFSVSTDNSSSVRWVKPLRGEKKSVVGFGLIGQMMNSMMAFPTSSAISDVTGNWRTNASWNYMKFANLSYATDSDFLTAIANEPGYVGKSFQNPGVVTFTYDNVKYISDADYAALFDHVNLDFATMGGAIRFSAAFKDLGLKRLIIQDTRTEAWSNALDSYIFAAPSFTRDFTIDFDATGFTSGTITIALDSGTTSGGDNSIVVDYAEPRIAIDNTDTGFAAWFFVAAGYCIPIYSTEIVKINASNGIAIASTGNADSTTREAATGYAYTVLLKEDYVPFMFNRSELGETYKRMINSLVKLVDPNEIVK